jgi:hypothetical protein
MYSISTSIIGSKTFGNEQEFSKDVDIVILYAQDPALQLLNSQAGILKTEMKKGMHLHYVEIGEMATRLCQGDSQAFIFGINNYVISTSPWQLLLESILKNNLTTLFADDLIKYCEMLVENEKEMHVPEPYSYPSMTYINFGLGYFKGELEARRELILRPVDTTYTKEQVLEKLEELKLNIASAKTLTYLTDDGQEKKVYDDEKFTGNLYKWVITTRHTLLKINENFN